MPTFADVPAKVDFPELERETLAWWEENGIVERYLHKNDDSPRKFSFLDGPITANNPMGVHHAWGRTYKDLFQRFHAMLGARQRFQNGFDGQGLWVEVEVEKELGLKSKRDIESYGIAAFVERCKERVRTFSARQTEQSIRLGYWMDWANSYHTMSDENNYTIWYFLKQCYERGWIYKGHDVMPWCPRCGTGLSEHEIVTEGYQQRVHLYYLVQEAAKSALRGDYTVLGEVKGAELVGWEYRGPFDELPAEQGIVHRVIAWDEVSAAEGTGIVHIAPGCGKEDFALSKTNDLPVVAP